MSALLYTPVQVSMSVEPNGNQFQSGTLDQAVHVMFKVGIATYRYSVTPAICSCFHSTLRISQTHSISNPNADTGNGNELYRSI